MTMDDARIKEIIAKQREVLMKQPSITVEVKLDLNSDETYSEFSYIDLMREKTGVGVEEENTGVSNPLQDVVKSLEKKHGPKCKAGRLKDLLDLGDGYDTTDSFIDNSEAYDELIPEDIDTKYGGFYINDGIVDFKENPRAAESAADHVKPRKGRPRKSTKRLHLTESDSDEEPLSRKRQVKSGAKLARQSPVEQQQSVPKPSERRKYAKVILSKHSSGQAKVIQTPKSKAVTVPAADERQKDHQSLSKKMGQPTSQSIKVTAASSVEQKSIVMSKDISSVTSILTNPAQRPSVVCSDVIAASKSVSLQPGKQETTNEPLDVPLVPISRLLETFGMSATPSPVSAPQTATPANSYEPDQVIEIDDDSG